MNLLVKHNKRITNLFKEIIFYMLLYESNILKMLLKLKKNEKPKKQTLNYAYTIIYKRLAEIQQSLLYNMPKRAECKMFINVSSPFV